MRTVGVQHTRHRQVEIAVIGGQARERGGSDRDAVIAADTRNEFLLRAPQRIVVVPDELHLLVVGFRARAAEEHFRGRMRRDGLEALGRFRRALMALAAENMREGDAAHLFGGRVDQLLLVVAERGAPEPGEPLDIFVALIVEDINALAALDDHRSGGAERVEIGVGMDHRLDIANGGVGQAHARAPRIILCGLAGIMGGEGGGVKGAARTAFFVQCYVSLQSPL